MYSSASAAGASIGVLLGGLLTDLLSWRWGLFINVPIGIVVVALAPLHLPDTEPQRGTSTSPAPDLGRRHDQRRLRLHPRGHRRLGRPGHVGAFAAGLLLLASFVRIERRAEQPITPLRLFASRTRSGAYVARMLAVGGMFSMFFFLTQYLQGVRGESRWRRASRSCR